MEEETTALADSDKGTKKHVFISYSWTNKETVLKISSRLKDLGFRVWIDVDKMEGSILSSMAEAVEDAAIVLVCMSKKYSYSDNCKAEGEYIFRLHKPIIPLMMEPGLAPRGWLGMLLGSKLYIDFYDQIPFDEAFKNLVKKLNGRGRGECLHEGNAQRQAGEAGLEADNEQQEEKEAQRGTVEAKQQEEEAKREDSRHAKEAKRLEVQRKALKDNQRVQTSDPSGSGKRQETETTENDASDSVARGKDHVFISHDWNRTETAIQIADELKTHGYRVWIDRNKKEQSTLEAISNAIEGAAVVIALVSSGYNASWKREMQYASMLEKPIVILFSQRHHTPEEGWFAKIKSGRPIIDFSDKVPFDDALGKLIGELKGRGRGDSLAQGELSGKAEEDGKAQTPQDTETAEKDAEQRISALALFAGRIGGSLTGNPLERVHAAQITPKGLKSNYRLVSAIPSIPHPKTQTAVVRRDDEVWIMGGESGETETSSCEVLDLGTLQWRKGADLHQARKGHTVTLLGSSFIAVGGFTSKGSLSSCETQTGSSEWSLTTALPQARQNHAATEWNGRVVVSGGCRGRKMKALSSVMSWMAGEDSWQPEPSLSAPRYLHTMSEVGSRLLVYGGVDANSRYNPNVEVYSTESKVWSYIDSPSEPGFQEDAAAVVHGGALYIVGGGSTITMRYLDEEFVEDMPLPWELTSTSACIIDLRPSQWQMQIQ